MAALTEVSRLTITLLATGQMLLKPSCDLSDLISHIRAAVDETVEIDDSLADTDDTRPTTARLVVAMMSDGSCKSGIHGDADALMARWKQAYSKMEACQ
ncbi:hypothetical protein [Aquitalea sp. LB_tupeE]|uniref:hypothetical protein n=1 Tax=Aquitalea sp. LB_tupeE TaxID=2748078 RepID=UPI0015B86689|nr:hypothetical protein [Aquitalea sp. LB_tupeE]NWK77222.1 hypothetical protein [Aquitalea sp. LB_tupeE]